MSASIDLLLEKAPKRAKFCPNIAQNGAFLPEEITHLKWKFKDKK
jgi:hypothetical protein